MCKISNTKECDYINAKHARLTRGAVNVGTGQMNYFDSRDRDLCATHVMASGVLPAAFPAVRIDGEPYWDGGIYSNTPIEVVLDDKPRRDCLIFAGKRATPTPAARSRRHPGSASSTQWTASSFTR